MTYDIDPPPETFSPLHSCHLTPEDFLNSSDPEERRAALILQGIDARNEQERALANPTADRREDLRALVDDLRGLLGGASQDNEIQRLEQQAKILDMAFRRLMFDADITYENIDRLDCDPMKYAAAFKAQDQYRRTIQTLKSLKKRGPYKKALAKRNENIE